MIVCPVCRASLVEVVAPGTTRQFICGCPGTTWAYRPNGDLGRLDASSGFDATPGVSLLGDLGGAS